MSEELDPKVAAILETMAEEIETKLQDRLKEKWPEYRETDSPPVQREILLSYYRRMATRWARAWLPATGDIELRAVEQVLYGYLEQTYGEDGSASDSSVETAHRVASEGLVYLGNALATVLHASQGGNQPSRLAAIQWVADALARGTEPVQILKESPDYEGPSTVGEADPNDVMD